MRAVTFTEGSASRPALVRRPDPSPGPRQVLVRTSFAAINPTDISQMRGLSAPPPGFPADILGVEVAGVVALRGAEVTKFRTGDRVFGIVPCGGLSELVVAHEDHVVAVPGNLGDAEAAAVPEAFITAFDAMVTQGHLASGEVLLVNGANGGVGTAAIQVARSLGARVYATVRSPDLRSRVQLLGADCLTSGELFSSTPAIVAPTMILELVGAPLLAADLRVLAPRGRVLLVGMVGGERLDLDLRSLIVKRCHLIGTILRSRSDREKRECLQVFEREVIPLLGAGTIRATIDKVFGADDVGEAFDHLQRPGKFGKVLLSFT